MSRVEQIALMAAVIGKMLEDRSHAERIAILFLALRQGIENTPVQREQLDVFASVQTMLTEYGQQLALRHQPPAGRA